MPRMPHAVTPRKWLTRLTRTGVTTSKSALNTGSPDSILSRETWSGLESLERRVLLSASIESPTDVRSVYTTEMGPTTVILAPSRLINPSATGPAALQVAAADFERLDPVGSLIFVSRNTGSLSSNGDQEFEFFIDEGQTVSIIATPADPSATLQVVLDADAITNTTAPGSGQPVVQAPVTVTTSQSATLTLATDAATDFTLEIYLNASLEAQVGETSDGNELNLLDALIELDSAGRFAVIGESAPNPGNDVDEYLLDLTGRGGQPIDIVLAGIEGANFANESLVLLDTDGSTVLATAQTDALGVDGANADLAILGFTIPEDGVYTLRVTAGVEGRYAVAATTSMTFDSEPNDTQNQPDQPLRSVDDTRAALGFLGELPTDSGGGEPVSQFQIDVIFTDNSLTPSQQAIFTDAANRWAQIIIGDVPDVFVTGLGLVDDVAIEASAPTIDGPGGILGQAGPRTLRSGSFIPASGVMQFDSADVANLETSGQLENVILHEMGHVLGIGTIWSSLGLLQGAGGADPRFLGAGATAEYNAIFDRAESSVPVANTGGSGTRDAHWRESVFNNELMTGFLDGGDNPLSRITVASLADMGYEVDLDAADPYTPPGSLTAEVAQSVAPPVGRLITLEFEPVFVEPIPVPTAAAAGSISVTLAGPVNLFTADFNDGGSASNDGFVVDNTGAPSAGLWHLTTGRGMDPGHSPQHSFYYGINEGPNGGGNFNVGHTAGRITSPTISLQDLSEAQLSFNYFLQTEANFVDFDIARVQVSRDAGPFVDVLSNIVGLQDPTNGFVQAVADLSDYIGGDIQVRFDFDTGDNLFNNFEGWFIDDVVVSGVSTLDVVDLYQITLDDGQAVTLFTETPPGGPLNDLDPSISIFDASGDLLTHDADSASDGRHAVIMFTAPQAGVYTVAVERESGTGEYVLRAGFPQPPTVVDVSVSSTEWTPAFLDATDPSFGVGFSVPVGNGDQLKPLAWVNIDQIHLRFNQDVRILAGDMNGDGAIDEDDNELFNLAISDPQAFDDMFPHLDAMVAADMNGDNTLDAGDTTAFDLAKTDLAAYFGMFPDAARLSVIGRQDTGSATGETLVDFAYDSTTFTATWTLLNPLNPDQYTVILSDEVRSPDTGLPLDGDWENPASVDDTDAQSFPSGDGTAGGDLIFIMNVLPGDANQDGAVGLTDFSTLQNHINQAGNQHEGDFNGDGLISFADFATLQNHFNQAIDTGASSPAASLASLLSDRNSDETTALVHLQDDAGLEPLRDGYTNRHRLGQPVHRFTRILRLIDQGTHTESSPPQRLSRWQWRTAPIRLSPLSLVDVLTGVQESIDELDPLG